MAESNLNSKLLKVQEKLKAPKNQYNSFGKYKYRNCEDILEAAKPLLAEQGLTLILSDYIEVADNGRTYVKAVASITDGKDTKENCAMAREPESKKGMDDSQVTGTASSYARKYALNGLFLIDDTKDADSMDNTTGATSTPSKPKAKTQAKPQAKAAVPAQPKPTTKVSDIKQKASDIVHRYCELHNADEKAVKNGIVKRPDFADTDEFWQKVFNEFNDQINEEMKGK
jgi:hypothetical protein